MDDNNKKELKRLRDSLQDFFGIYYPDNKLFKIESKSKKRIRETSHDSIRAYVQDVYQNKQELNKLVNITIPNKTSFFREDKQWDYIDRDILVNWSDKKEIKAWSAACSTGQEPYSLAFLIQDEIDNGLLSPNFNYKILGTDIDDDALKTAENGVYTYSEIQDIVDYDPKLTRQFVEKNGKNRCSIKDRIKKNITFRKFNLKFNKSPFECKFDLIMIRNVLIYFQKDTKRMLINECIDLLKENGYLIVGRTENLMDVGHNLIKMQPSIYKKPK